MNARVRMQVGNVLLIEEIKKIIVALSKKVDDIGT